MRYLKIKKEQREMRNILNAILTFLVFWVGNEYFKEYISISDTKTIIIATLLMVAMGYLFSLLMMASVLTIPLGIGCLTTIILFFVAIVLTPVKLWLLDKYLMGFYINGFWAYIVLTAILSIFTIKVKSSQVKQ